MSKTFEKHQKKRLQSSYLSVIVSIALVLFLVGLLGIIVLKTQALAQHFREQVTLNIFLSDDANVNQIANYKKELQKKEYTQKVEFVSKEDAAELMQKEIGQDFLEFLGTNPLKNVINIHLKSDFVTAEKMKEIEKSLVKNKIVHEITYDKPLIELLNKNIKRISVWILIFSGLLTLIAVVLINSSIRLSVYSKRFTIKTMQMVGATKSFIRRPFIWTSIKLGILGALLAIIALIGMGYYIEKQIPEIKILNNIEMLLIVFGGVLVLGVLITWLSTFFATRRFLNLRTNELYY
ncbi:MAG TPA: FtsX-like permease family protein [Lutibacter sp.]|nr:FtsX-like permease family protein [Lutibacter sp.]